MKKLLLTSIIYLALTTLLFAQPANDVCSNAIIFPPITSDGSQVCLSGNNEGASPEESLEGCNMSTEEVVWYRFIPDGTAALASIILTAQDAESPTIQIFK